MNWLLVGVITLRLLGPILFFLILARVWVGLTDQRRRKEQRRGHAANVALLRQRFAEGRIDALQYRERLSVLSEPGN